VTRHHPSPVTPARPHPLACVVAAVAGALGFVLLLLVVLLTGGADRPDAAVLRWTVAARSPVLTPAAHALTLLGSVPVVLVVAVLAAALLRRRTRGWTSSAVLLTAVVVTGAVVYLFKVAVGRTRPSLDTVLGTPSPDYAFPSGHTTDGTVVYVLAALLLAATLRTAARRRVLVGAAVLLGLVIGLTRVYLGYHWLTDVLAGWSLATAVVLTAFVVAQLVAGNGLRAPTPSGAATGAAASDAAPARSLVPPSQDRAR